MSLRIINISKEVCHAMQMCDTRSRVGLCHWPKHIYAELDIYIGIPFFHRSVRQSMWLSSTGESLKRLNRSSNNQRMVATDSSVSFAKDLNETLIKPPRRGSQIEVQYVKLATFDHYLAILAIKLPSVSLRCKSHQWGFTFSGLPCIFQSAFVCFYGRPME